MAGNRSMADAVCEVLMKRAADGAVPSVSEYAKGVNSGGYGNTASRIGGTGALLAGGALAGSGLLGDNNSTMGSIGKTLGGAALAYIGHQALTNPEWQQAIGDYSGKAMDYVRGLVAKYLPGRQPMAKASAYTGRATVGRISSRTRRGN